MAQEGNWKICDKKEPWKGQYLEHASLVYLVCAGLSNRLCRVGVQQYPHGDSFPLPHHRKLSDGWMLQHYGMVFSR